MKRKKYLIFILIVILIINLIQINSFASLTAEKTKNNGIYKIAVGRDPSKVMEVKGADENDNGIVDIKDYGNTLEQKFYFEYQNEGYYKITAMHTGKSLTIRNNTYKEGIDIIQSDYNALSSQKWILRDSKINGWIISPLNCPKLAISIEKNIKNGERLILSKTQDNDNQMFYLFNISEESRKKENGIYKIAVGKNPSKVMEVKGADMSNNAIIDIWDYGNASQQKFKLEYQDEGYYKITAMHTDKSLTVLNNNVSNNERIVQDEYRGNLGQKWILKDTHINGWVISPLSRPDLSITIENTIKNGSNMILKSLTNNDNQMFYIYKVKIPINIDSYKYPGIEERINQLSNVYPNWKFEILYTTLNFNTAVEEEYLYANKKGNLVYTPTYKGDWIAPNPYVSGNWASASYNAIAYFMDPRNFLNEKDIFQFIDLADYASSGVTENALQYQTQGTFLQNHVFDVNTACRNTNINPYYVLARLFQEQGRNGSSTINMDGKDGKYYYNPFNIGAQVGNDYQTALNKAKNNGWDTMAKGIEGGIKIIKSYYIDKKQNTLYLNKFDINPASGGGFYNHQYMQNLSAAYSEARILRSSYVDTNAIDNEIKFIIPVYENMPKTVSEKPTGKNTVEYNNENINSNDRVQVKTKDNSGVNVRSGAGIRYKVIKAVIDNTTGTRIVTNKYYSDGLWWDEVIFDDGTRGFVASNYLVKI